MKGAATATAATTTTEDDEEAKTKSNGALGTATNLRGANELQAVAFAGSAVSPTPAVIRPHSNDIQGVGAIEIEYQNADTRTLTVVENKSPAAAPGGLVFADTSSY